MNIISTVGPMVYSFNGISLHPLHQCWSKKVDSVASESFHGQYSESLPRIMNKSWVAWFLKSFIMFLRSFNIPHIYDLISICIKVTSSIVSNEVNHSYYNDNQSTKIHYSTSTCFLVWSIQLILCSLLVKMTSNRLF